MEVEVGSAQVSWASFDLRSFLSAHSGPYMLLWRSELWTAYCITYGPVKSVLLPSCLFCRIFVWHHLNSFSAFWTRPQFLELASIDVWFFWDRTCWCGGANLELSTHRHIRPVFIPFCQILGCLILTRRQLFLRLAVGGVWFFLPNGGPAMNSWRGKLFASEVGVNIYYPIRRIVRATTPWRNGSASDSRSEGCVFKSRRGH